MKTQAVVFPEPNRVEIRDMETPDPEPDQVGIRTVFSGISQGTERWAYTGRYGHFDRDYSLQSPVQAIRDISHDPGLRETVKLKDGRAMTALEIQKEYLEACLAYAQHVDADPVTRDVLDRWWKSDRGPEAMDELRELFTAKLEETRENLLRIQTLERELVAGLEYLETCRLCGETGAVDCCVHCQQDHGVEREPMLVAGFKGARDGARRPVRPALVRVEEHHER